MRIEQTEDGSLSPFHEELNESYHCKGGALAKAQSIFLRPVLEKRQATGASRCRILEVGFGAGLNFFVTADAFTRIGIPLDYTALENNLLPADTLNSLHYDLHLGHPSIFRNYLQWRESVAAECETTCCLPVSEEATLHLRIGDATRQSLPEAYFDWVYLDPFSPRSNPDLWSEAFLARLYDCLVPDGGLASYCVAGEVRQRMEDIGFIVTRQPGIPYKKEVLLAWK